MQQFHSFDGECFQNRINCGDHLIGKCSSKMSAISGRVVTFGRGRRLTNGFGSPSATQAEKLVNFIELIVKYTYRHSRGSRAKSPFILKVMLLIPRHNLYVTQWDKDRFRIGGICGLPRPFSRQFSSVFGTLVNAARHLSLVETSRAQKPQPVPVEIAFERLFNLQARRRAQSIDFFSKRVWFSGSHPNAVGPVFQRCHKKPGISQCPRWRYPILRIAPLAHVILPCHPRRHEKSNQEFRPNRAGSLSKCDAIRGICETVRRTGQYCQLPEASSVSTPSSQVPDRSSPLA